MPVSSRRSRVDNEDDGGDDQHGGKDELGRGGEES